MNELRECPFCGGDAEFYFRKLEGVGMVVSLKIIVQEWNRRAKDENA